jgi:hypothetical protein
MSLCVHCGLPALGADELCPHHTSGYGDDWATGNRVMCDFLHRGIVSATPRELADVPGELIVGMLAAAVSG